MLFVCSLVCLRAPLFFGDSFGIVSILIGYFIVCFLATFVTALFTLVVVSFGFGSFVLAFVVLVALDLGYPLTSAKLSRPFVGFACVVVKVVPACFLGSFDVVAVIVWCLFGLRRVCDPVSLLRLFSLLALWRGFFDKVSHVGGLGCWESRQNVMDGHCLCIFLKFFHGYRRRCENYATSGYVLKCSIWVLDHHRFRVYLHVLNAERAFRYRRELMPILLVFLPLESKEDVVVFADLLALITQCFFKRSFVSGLGFL